MNQAAPSRDRPKMAERTREAVAIFCLMAGFMHILGGGPFTMLFGIGYSVAGVGLFRKWGPAANLARATAAVRGVGTLLLIFLKLPDLLNGTAEPGVTGQLLRDLFWLVMNAAILVLLGFPEKRTTHDRGGCV